PWPSRPASPAASVLLPEPFGPMIACTSPAPKDRSIPRRISRPSVSRACKLLISSIFIPLLIPDRGRLARMRARGPRFQSSSDAAFEAHRQQLLRFDRKFHWQLFQHLLAEAVDDQRYRVFGAEAALAAIKQLILADFRCRCLVLDAS